MKTPTPDTAGTKKVMDAMFPTDNRKAEWFGDIRAMTIMFVILACVAVLVLTGLFTIVMAVIHWLQR